jgi:superfamily II DNA or RNA helicase
MNLRPYQQTSLTQTIEQLDRNPIMVMPTGCHAAGQKIMLFNGHTKNVEDITINDWLIGPDGRSRKVLKLIHGVGELYEITPTKGAPFVVNLDHILTLVRTGNKSRKSGEIIDISLREWMDWPTTSKHIHKLFRTKIAFSFSPKLNIDPYFLGVLLGDGSWNGSIGITKEDPEIVDVIYQQAAKYKLKVNPQKYNNKCTTWLITGKTGGSHKAHDNLLLHEIKKLKLRATNSSTKFIPHIYKISTIENRLQILAGLLDTDGSLSRNNYDYISKSPTLAHDLTYIARSVGLAAYVKKCTKTCQNNFSGEYYRVSISGDCSIIPCRIPRKKASLRHQKKNVLRTGFSVKHIGLGKYYGFVLTNDGRYLLDDFTVTHNSGKTVAASALVKQLDRRTLWLAHRQELITQAANTLNKHGLRTGIIMAGYEPCQQAPVQVASVQTLIRRPPVIGIGLIVVDESHHAAGNSYQTILNQYTCPRVGLTATPFRLDGKGLGDLFGAIVNVVTTADLIEQGYLHKPKVWSHSTPNLSGVKKTAGDYNLRQLDNAVNQSVLIGDIVATWQRRASGKKTVVFATSIDHSKNIVAAFRAAGVKAEHLDGSTPKDERDAILGRLRCGWTTVVSNCMVLTEGWDLPALECAVIARPTASLCLHLQMLGRIMRACDGKESCIVLDHAGNHHMHGSVTRPLSYSLESGPVSRPGEPLGLKTCPECFLMVESATKECPECGYVFKAERPVKYAGGDLSEFDEDSFEYRAEYLEAIEGQRLLCGYKPGWTAYRYEERFGEMPALVHPYGSSEPGIMVNPDGDMVHKKLVWQALERTRREKGYKQGWTAWRYKDYFKCWPKGVMDEETKNSRLVEQLNQRYKI